MSKTQLTPKQLFERRNTDNVFNRLVIAGLLRILNQKLVYEQIWSDDEDGIENVTVPFFYDFGGGNINSERFIQDNYTFFSSDECTEIGLKKIDGNYDFYPHGRINLTSVSIDSGNITNRFSMGTYTKLENGKMVAYTSYLYAIPLTFQFSVEIRTNTMNSAFKIDQAFREFFYKNKTFHFNYRGTVVACRAGFPENGISGAASTYTMGAQPQDNWIKLTSSIQCETYQPVFDKFSERRADNIIKSVGANIWVNNDPEPQHRTGPIYWKTDFSQRSTLVSGQDIMLEWNYSYMDRDLLYVDICYKLEGDDREYLIDSIDNHLFYCWNIPYDFTENDKIDIMIPNTDLITVATPPEIYIYPDPKTNTVEPENVYVKGKGFFIVPQPDYKVDAIISYTNRNDEIVEYPAVLNLRNYMIDEIDGINFNCFVYDNVIKPVRVKLIVRDHYQKENFCETDWLSII